MGVSENKKVLSRMPIKGKNLPSDPRRRQWAIEREQRSVRDSIIYREWLLSDDKEGAYVSLAERFGFTRPGDVKRLIEKQRKNGVGYPQIAANIEGIKQARAAKVIRDAEKAQVDFDMHLDKLYEAQADGEEWVEVEFFDGKNKYTKSIPIDTAIKMVHFDKMRMYRQEAENIEAYSGVKATMATEEKIKAGQARFSMQVTAEFLREWERLRDMDNNKVIEVEVEECGD